METPCTESLKLKLKDGKFTIGSWISLAHPAIAEIMSDAGFDWLTIDMEHSVITIREAEELIRVISLKGKTPLVRVTSNDANQIKRVMDAGSHGVIVPMVNSREAAEAAVAAVKYPPTGNRGVGLARAQRYGVGFDSYKKWLEVESVVIVQIEHINAIQNLEQILSVPGVDGSIIGPYDLSGSLGCPGEFQRSEVLEALQRYETVCRKLAKPMGFHVVPTDVEMVKSYRDKGYTFIAAGVDMLYLGNKCTELLKGIGP